MNLTHDRFSSVVFFYITFAIDSNDPIREGFFCELRIVKSVNVVPRTPSRFIFVCVRFDNKLSVESFPLLVSCFQLKSENREKWINASWRDRSFDIKYKLNAIVKCESFAFRVSHAKTMTLKCCLCGERCSPPCWQFIPSWRIEWNSIQANLLRKQLYRWSLVHFSQTFFFISLSFSLRSQHSVASQ